MKMAASDTTTTESSLIIL